jgi:uncharacterized protein YndB with AHSA1/START domain
MGFESLTVSTVVPTTSDCIYAAWLDSAAHERMTGGESVLVQERVGSSYAAWDAHASGKILELEPGRRIVQSWRTTEFLPSEPDSRVELHLRDVPGGCDVMILHTEIPQGLAEKYEDGWRTHVLLPMSRYFRKSSERGGPQPGNLRSRRGPPRKSAPARGGLSGSRSKRVEKG